MVRGREVLDVAPGWVEPMQENGWRIAGRDDAFMLNHDGSLTVWGWIFVSHVVAAL